VKSHRRGRGQTAYKRPPEGDAVFRHARGRAAVPPRRLAETSELPIHSQGREVVEVRMALPMRIEFGLWLCASLLVVVVLTGAWLVGRLREVERAVEAPVVVISPSSVPVP
jgi:hypothetical protein